MESKRVESYSTPYLKAAMAHGLVEALGNETVICLAWFSHSTSHFKLTKVCLDFRANIVCCILNNSIFVLSLPR